MFRGGAQLDLTAHDVAREESFGERINTGSLGRVEPTDQAEVFEGNGRLNEKCDEQEFAREFRCRDLGCSLRQSRVRAFRDALALWLRLRVGLAVGSRRFQATRLLGWRGLLLATTQRLNHGGRALRARGAVGSGNGRSDRTTGEVVQVAATKGWRDNQERRQPEMNHCPHSRLLSRFGKLNVRLNYSRCRTTKSTAICKCLSTWLCPRSRRASFLWYFFQSCVAASGRPDLGWTIAND